MMKLVLGIMIAALVAVGLWFGMSAQAPASGPVSEQETTTQDSGATQAQGTLAAIFGMSGSYRCTVTSDAPTGFARGTVQVKDGNVRGEFITTSGGKEMTAMMIKIGETVYTWSSAMPMGVKAAASSLDGGDAQTPTSDSTMFDTGAAVDYDCVPASIDDGAFVPPAEIEFMDMTQGMPKMPDVSKMMQ